MNSPRAPLAETLRPQTFDQVVGQDTLLQKESVMQRSIALKKPLSFLLWGPPGSGKTTLARLYAKQFQQEMRHLELSAVFSGVQDLRKIIQDERAHPLFQKGVILFVDEIHRFNKAQQDAFLPFIEDGTLFLIGATTENPSFYLNSALLSRLRVLELQPLSKDALSQLLLRYEEKMGTLPLTEKAKERLIHHAQGDGRFLFNLIENLHPLPTDHLLDLEEVEKWITHRPSHFSRGGDEHFNLISALHKAVRGSDPQATLYWLARLLNAKEEPLYIARRLIRMAVEDVGLADPEALQVAVHAKSAYELLGSPEGELALAEAATYLALAPKSNALYTAFKKAKEEAEATSYLPPPKTILNAPTKVMKDLGYSDGYQYDHDCPNGFSGQNYFPEGVERNFYYQPVERGFEREMKKRISYFESLRECDTKSKK